MYWEFTGNWFPITMEDWGYLEELRGCSILIDVWRGWTTLLYLTWKLALSLTLDGDMPKDPLWISCIWDYPGDWRILYGVWTFEMLFLTPTLYPGLTTLLMLLFTFNYILFLISVGISWSEKSSKFNIFSSAGWSNSTTYWQVSLFEVFFLHIPSTTFLSNKV